MSKLSAKERRAILRRITEEIYNKKKAQGHVESRNYSPFEVLLSDFASSIGIELSESGLIIYLMVNAYVMVIAFTTRLTMGRCAVWNQRIQMFKFGMCGNY
nr:Uncharacterised protein [Klebsiella pneumoniae]